jgi:hypothetical protein
MLLVYKIITYATIQMYLSTKKDKGPLVYPIWLYLINERGIINSITFLLIFSSEKNKAENILELSEWVSYYYSET